jgi:hypothetical protein
VHADQDTDGSHIRGLVINFFHTFWPSLVKMKGETVTVTDAVLSLVAPSLTGSAHARCVRQASCASSSRPS